MGLGRNEGADRNNTSVRCVVCGKLPETVVNPPDGSILVVCRKGNDHILGVRRPTGYAAILAWEELNNGLRGRTGGPRILRGM